ncbi:fimbrial protein [Aquitalea pelogenes]|uniref:fimbrial protein n=1 Tax=Aquitalea pelogenes TaxID=1293573 RepID=UPI0009EB03EB|nr:fimbrial protein [Aquitalea pelogenes]
MYSAAQKKQSSSILKNALTRILLVLVLFCSAQTTLATCSALDSTNGLNYYTYIASGFNPPPFNPSNYTINQVIYSKNTTLTLNNGSGTNRITCTSPWSTYYIGIGTDNQNIYPTGISGLGLRLTLNNGKYLPTIGSTFRAGEVRDQLSSFSIFIELIKTGNITTTGYLMDRFMEIRNSSTSGELLNAISWGTPISITPTIPTCTVSTPSITVPLNNMLSSSFKGVGSVSATQNFQIGLSCAGGSSGTSTNTYITFTDNNQPGNTSTTLTLAGGTGAATGLGLQILNNGTPIGYGPDSNAPGNTNQWKVANIAQGVSSYLIPLGVRYIQTSSPVTPGTVTGRATFTMSYQ